jgi:hypothetical protein
MSDQRQYSRHCIELPVRFSSDDLSDEGVVRDLSMGGCRVHSEAIIVAGDFLGMLIMLPGRHAPLAISLATVRWSANQEFGVEFIRIEPEHQTLLRRVIDKLEPESRQPSVKDEHHLSEQRLL